MPDDDVKPCPHCNGTGELRGGGDPTDMTVVNNTLDAIRRQARKAKKAPAAARRTCGDVLEARNGFGGCCDKNVDRCGCFCFEDAERYETARELDAGRPPPRRCPTCGRGGEPSGKVYDSFVGCWKECDTCDGKGLLYGLLPEGCGVPGMDLECVGCGVRLYGKRAEDVCPYKGGGRGKGGGGGGRGRGNLPTYRG